MPTSTTRPGKMTWRALDVLIATLIFTCLI